MLMGIAFLIIADVLRIENSLSKAAVIFGIFFSVYGLFYNNIDDPKKKNDVKEERNDINEKGI